MARFTGQVGYVVAGMKSTKEAHIGDTFYNPKQPVEALPGFKPAKPMVSFIKWCIYIVGFCRYLSSWYKWIG